MNQKEAFVLKVPYKEHPNGNLYKNGKHLGYAFKSASGMLHYFDEGDICRIGHDEYETKVAA